MSNSLIAVPHTHYWPVSLPSELRLEASETSFVHATLSSLTLALAGILEPSSARSAGAPANRFLAIGEWATVGLWRRIVEKRLTNDVLCLNLCEYRTRVWIKKRSDSSISCTFNVDVYLTCICSIFKIERRKGQASCVQSWQKKTKQVECWIFKII